MHQLAAVSGGDADIGLECCVHELLNQLYPGRALGVILVECQEFRDADVFHERQLDRIAGGIPLSFARWSQGEVS